MKQLFVNDLMLFRTQSKSKSERMEEIKQKLLEEREAQIQQSVEKTLSGADLPESRFTQLERLQHTQVRQFYQCPPFFFLSAFAVVN